MSSPAGPPPAERQMTLAEVQALRAEIGVLDAAQARDWKPPAGANGRIIRGATGSPWVNRLSTLVLLLIVALVLALVLGLHHLVGEIAQTLRPPAPMVCRVAPGQPTPRLDVFQQVPGVVTGQLQLSPKMGTHQIDSLQQRRVQRVQYQGAEVRIWRSLLPSDSLQAIDVVHPTWSPCEVALAARWARSGDTLQLGRDGAVTVRGQPLAAPAPGWHYRLEAQTPAGSRVRVERD